MLLLALSQIYTRVFNFWKSFDLDSPQSCQDRATRIVILTNFRSISVILGDISRVPGTPNLFEKTLVFRELDREKDF